MAVVGREEKLVRHLIKTQTNIPTTVYGSQTMHLKCPEFQVFFQKDFDCIDSVLIFSKKKFKIRGSLGFKILFWLSSCDGKDKDKDKVLCILGVNIFSGVNVFQG